MLEPASPSGNTRCGMRLYWGFREALKKDRYASSSIMSSRFFLQKDSLIIGDYYPYFILKSTGAFEDTQCFTMSSCFFL